MHPSPTPSLSLKTMFWIRSLEKAAKRHVIEQHAGEYEFASECRIPGVLSYEKGGLRAGGTTERNERGLYQYLMRLSEFLYDDEDRGEWELADTNGYSFPGPWPEELLALFAVFFRCRFYLMSSSFGELTDHSIKHKQLHSFTYIRPHRALYPQILQTSDERNFAIGLTEFLNQIRRLPDKYHRRFALACYHYHKALREVGIDEEMMFIRLVSAVECLMSDPEHLPDDPFPKLLSDFCNLDQLDERAKESIEFWFKEGRRTEGRFTHFILTHHDNFSYPAGYEHLEDAKQLTVVLRTIYKARSAYLHKAKPMFLNDMRFEQKVPAPNPKTRGKIEGQQMWLMGELLPGAHFFEGLVRQCIRNYLQRLSRV